MSAEHIQPAAGAVYAEDARAHRVYMRAIAVTQAGERQPWSSLGYKLKHRDLLVFLMRDANVPPGPTCALMRIDAHEMAQAWDAVLEARRFEPAIGAWLDRMAKAVPDFNEPSEAA